jgi:nicotinamidase-related amidase
MTFWVKPSDGLIIVDFQKDFCAGGALPVPNCEEILPMVNEYIKVFVDSTAPIYATRDWHPPNHVSFLHRGGPWPPHCVQNTEGARFHPELKLPANVTIVSKGSDPDKESYSGFDNTRLAERLKSARVKRVFVCGLATDYCVKNTVLDALRLGFTTVLLVDATKGIDAHLGDVEKAVEKMIKSGAERATLEEVESLPLEDFEGITDDDLEEDPLLRAETKRKARFRSRGPYRKVKAER